MLRCGLVSYLMFAFAAGPGFCCCTATHLANRAKSLLSGGSTKPFTCPYCPQCTQHSESANTGKPGPAEKSYPGKPKSCPCQIHRSAPVSDKSDGETECKRLLQISFESPSADNLDVLAAPVALSVVNASSLWNWSRVYRSTAAATLSILQVFRC